MVEYSFTLGDWGKYLWVAINLKYDGLIYNGYNSRSFVVKPSKIRIFEIQRSCNSCLEDIYSSKYDYKTNIYSINFNPDIIESWENILELESKIIDIETLAIGIHNIVVNSHLDSSNGYKMILIYFERDVSDYNKIDEEIKESIIFGQSIPKEDKSIDKPVFEFKALKDKKNDLSYPDYYKFGFRIYES